MPVVKSQDMPWQTYRDIRLRALETDPEQFGSTFERESTFPDDRWAERAMTPGTFLWVGGDEPDASSQVAPRAEGLASALAPTDAEEAAAIARTYGIGTDGFGFVVQVWVQPARRGTGVIDELLSAAIEHARSQGWKLLVLHVVKENERAAGAYRRHGFTKSGHAALGECTGEDEYVLRLG